MTGPGLKKEGVVVLQSFFIAFFTGIELLFRSGAGIISGVILCLVLFGGIRFGRKGTTYVAVVTPPLAFAATVLLFQILSVGLSPSRLGLEFIASLAGIAPFLMASALYGWYIYLNQNAKLRAPKPRN
jgi:hypothetical protein